jgi:heme b synthase
MLKTDTPKLIFWELTKSCNLRCAHCRAEAENQHYEGELSFEQVSSVIDNIASFSKPILVLTGGEPLFRKDIFDIAAYAVSKGLIAAMATNGTLIDRETAAKIKSSGIRRCSISIDGKNAASHDGFRGIPGSFDSALNGAALLKEAGVEFQFNATITRRNKDELDEIINLAVERGAAALHAFMLVPVGCGVEIAESDMLPKEEYERILNWLYERTAGLGIEFKATCAPHYYRIIRQRAKAEGRSVTMETHGMAAMTRGCLAGSGVCFISNTGDVQPCGYLPVKAGNVLQTPFSDIWTGSELFLNLRDMNNLKGKCGRCEYKFVCAGCRARAFYDTGDYFEEEPYCVYEPVKKTDN